MRPGVLKRAFVVVGCGALTVTFAACESTESESAKIDREAVLAREHEPGALKIGTPSRTVHASEVTLLGGGGRGAVALRLTSSSTHAQANVPVLVEVKGKAGKLLYSNQPGGTDTKLQHIALLRPHASAWWVDDQVLINQPSSSVTVRVGSGGTAKSSDAPAVSVSRTSGVSTGGTVSGELVNHTGRVQRNVSVYAVGLRRGKIVAAGRVLVATLAARNGSPAHFEIPLVGNAAGAKIELTAVPRAVVRS
ncbi:MAG TPA: hypothetical protein VK774_10700 [Solirubrobacteraceae bacterium]|nr:hypothetical protein [Solirubrobacteraceae bacterium]